MKIAYYQDNRISQSKLKKILVHPQAFLGKGEYTELPNDRTLIGNAVDCILTCPELFDNEFKVVDYNCAISGQYKEFVEILFTTRNYEENGFTKEEWYNWAFNKVASKRFTLESFIKQFEDGEPHYSYLMSNLDFQLITNDQYAKVIEMVSAYRQNPYTSVFLEDAIGQEEIFWEYKGVEMKSRIDLFQQVDKSITPIEIKTTEFLSQFPYVFNRFRYDFQAVAYTEALKSKYPDYTINPFAFLVQGTKYVGKPAVFRLNEETMIKAKADFDNAIERYLFHSSTDQWDYPMEVYQGDGVIWI